MKIVFSWDDGAREDLKLISMHEKHDLPAMFFVPTINREGRDVLTAAEIKSADSSLISFGGHTQNHSFLTMVERKDLDEEIYKNQEYLSDILGKKIEHFCLPGGKYNDEVLSVAYKYYKTVRTADTMNFKNPDVLIKPSFHLYPRGYKSLIGNAVRNKSKNELLNLLLHPHREYFKTLKELIDMEAGNEKAEVVFWGHSWELEEFDLWNDLENIMSFISNNYKESCISYNCLFDK